MKLRYLVTQILVVLLTVTAVTLFAVPVMAEHYKRTTIFVEKLVCASCLTMIEENFQNNSGVAGMTADMSSGTVTVDHIEKISGQQLADAVSKLGYPASLIKEEVIKDTEITKFSKSIARCGVGGCRSGGGCNAAASAWKELYKKFVTN